MSLSERWLGLADSIWDGVVLRPSPFGLLNGRQDYRALAFPEAVEVVGRRLVNADLARATLSALRLIGCSFEGCSFERADFSRTGEHGGSFCDCDFLRTDFRHSLLGYDGSRYKRCRFDRCNFACASFIRAEFDDCEFLDCSLTGIDFKASSFVRCSFEGRLKSVWFRGDYAHPDEHKSFGKPRPNKMEDVSFEEAELIDVMFYNRCPLDKVRLPREGDYILIRDFQERLIWLDAEAARLRGEARERLQFFVKISRIHWDQKDRLLNLEDTAKVFGPDVAEAVRRAFS